MCEISLLGKVVCMCYLSALSVMDIKTRRLSGWILWLGAVLALAYRVVWRGQPMILWLSGAVVGLLFLAIGKVTGEALGYGDGVLIGILGIYLGIWDLLGLLATTFFLTALFAAAVLVISKFKRKSAFPFVPFLGAAYVIVLAAGVVAARYERKAGFQGEMDVEEFFRSQVAGKLILFSGMRVEADKTKDEVRITVSAQKGGMSLEVMQCAVISKPEEMIRRMSILKGVLPEGGED